MLLDQDDTKAAKEVARTVQLETARQKIVDLKTMLDTIQVKYESAENEIECYIPQIQDFKLEPQVLELQGSLKINDNLKKEVDELQQVCVSLLKENEQLKGEKVGFEASLTQNQADFYKLGYVDHLFGRSFDFEFSGKDFETLSISPEDLLAFTFESYIGEVVGEIST
ncbi:hypothetical protein TB2_007780 [Malus domestica]